MRRAGPRPDPSAADLADIALQITASAAALGIEPAVALISFSTPFVEFRPPCRQGDRGDEDRWPLQYDAAAVASVASSKRPWSPLAGRATVFVFPDSTLPGTRQTAVAATTEHRSGGCGRRPVGSGEREGSVFRGRGELVANDVLDQDGHVGSGLVRK